MVAAESSTTSAVGVHELPDDVGVYVCVGCAVPVALQDECVSKSFTGRSGRCFLFNTTVNTDIGEPEERKLLTGEHTVADLRCAVCAATLGWYYVRAPTAEQRYKEGRYVLECQYVAKENGWGAVPGNAR
ncbi:hypothetical protein Q5752_004282 [Cryptotrichosporon argae]